ncbi:carboxypeptidase-like regulatory domain-containing protein [candidate division KSB1 bacterium]|nr:carboxypeptidase-like regulatory domain-containing protein [candidate division KSB1 bacterium]
MLVVVLTILSSIIFAQSEKGTIKFHIVSKESGESLENAYIVYNNNIAKTDHNGILLLSLKPDTYHIVIKYIGYHTVERTITVSADSSQLISIKMELSPIQLTGVTIEAERLSPERKMMKIGPGFHRITNQQLLTKPSSLEPEILRVLSQLPGVHTTNELSTQLNVRGGTPDQNLFMLNGMRLFNLYHLLGLNSIIQPELVNDVYFSSAAFPAYYGNALSSVIDVDTPKPGDKINVEGGLSIVSSRIRASLPIFQNTALTFAARYAFWNLILGDQLPYYFTDVFVDFQHEFNIKHYLQTSYFSSRDVFDRKSNDINLFERDDPDSKYKEREQKLYRWNTSSFMVKWQYNYSRNFTGQVIVSFSKMNNDANALTRLEAYSDLSDIYLQQLSELKKQLQNDAYLSDNQLTQSSISWNINFKHVQAGIYYERGTFNYWWQNIIGDQTDQFYFDNAPENYNYKAYQQNISLFFFWLWEPCKMMKFQPGLRTTYSPDYSNLYWEPRFSTQYYILANLIFSIGISRHIQMIATAREQGLFGYFDLYFPLRNRPETADHYVASVKWNLFKSNEIVAEFYQKKFNDLLHHDTDFRRQPGKADGLEIGGRHTGGKINIDLFYTYTHSYRSLNGRQYATNFDIRHRVLCNGSIKLTKRWQLTWIYHFHTGQPYDSGEPNHYYGRRLSLNLLEQEPVYNATIADETIMPRGSIRYPNYSRLDMSLLYAFHWKKLNIQLFLSVINALNNKNLITYDQYDFGIPKPENSGIKLPDLEYNLLNAEFLPIIPFVGIQWGW